MSSRDTIVALSSGSLPAGVAVIRVSGPAAHQAARSLVGELPQPGRTSLRWLRDGDERLDQGLVLRFDAPHSFSGENVVELQVHGGRASVDRILEALVAHPCVRIAEAGEFTQQAFRNGRLDLTQVEGLSDLLAAETEQQRALALQTADGAFRRVAEDWRARILHARAMVESSFDFADEDDVPDDVGSAAWADLEALRMEVRTEIDGFRRGRIARDGFRVVLAGPPNAGKSSILNALARAEIAIVTDVAGTTRDRLDAAIDLEGIRIVVTDTAGMREGAGIVEREGIRRARVAMEEADLVVWCSPPDGGGERPPEGALVVRTKDDRDTFEELSVSVRRDGGLDALTETIAERAGAAVGPEPALVSRLRQRDELVALDSALSEALRDDPLEVRAEALRRAGLAIGRLTGTIGTEEMLGVIFSSFCVGK